MEDSMKFAALVFLLLLSVGTTVARAQNEIKYVVVIFQENRSTDNLFHGLPGADIAKKGTNSKGQVITLTSESLVGTYDLGHKHSDFVKMYDHGKMDGA